MSLNPVPNLPQEHSLLSLEHYHYQACDQFLPVTLQTYKIDKEQEQSKVNKKREGNEVLVGLNARNEIHKARSMLIW